MTDLDIAALPQWLAEVDEDLQGADRALAGWRHPDVTLGLSAARRLRGALDLVLGACDNAEADGETVTSAAIRDAVLRGLQEPR